MTNALNGAHILVTRPAHQADNLCQLIEAQGGIPVRFPTIEIVGLDEAAQATNPKLKLSNFQWLIFTSANAVNFALAANGGKIGQFGAAQIAAIGKTTGLALADAGLTVDLLPENGFDSEALLAMPPLQHVQGQAILIIKGKGGRSTLAEGLRARGARVENWEVYRRVMPKNDSSQVLDLLSQDKLNALIATSCEALQNLTTMLAVENKKKLTMIPLIVISDRIKALAVELGFARIAVAKSPSDQAIVAAIIALTNGE